LIHYIKSHEQSPQFFSDFGSYVHELIAAYLNGEISKEDIATAYLSGFRKSVRGKAPNEKIFQSYFEQGYEYFDGIQFPHTQILGVEKQYDFDVGGIPFTGIIDCIAFDDNQVVIVDNKSRALKPHSNRRKLTKSDFELRAYFRQLYLYSIPIKREFGEYPARLEFNCFRTGQIISEPFNKNDFDDTITWVKSQVETITDNDVWQPNMDYWKCRYICGFHDSCEYFQMSKG
jgi:ATP-dependent exoDNAse (exonuclease V) beta subunit